MTQLIRNKVFDDRLFHNRQKISGYVLENCAFESSRVAPDWSDPDPKRRPTLRNITLRNTAVLGGHVDGAIIENVTVDTTKGGKAPLFLRGNAYKHVTLMGRIAYTEIRGQMLPSMFDPEETQKKIIARWDEANVAYYKNVDWALDITEATYASFSISGIPSKLIRRNLENTAVVTRERALAGKWKKLPTNRGLFQIVIWSLLNEGYEDAVLIACPKSKGYTEDLEDLAALREIGVAE